MSKRKCLSSNQSVAVVRLVLLSNHASRYVLKCETIQRGEIFRPLPKSGKRTIRTGPHYYKDGGGLLALVREITVKASNRCFALRLKSNLYWGY